MFVPIDGAYYMYNKHYVIVHDREVYKDKTTIWIQKSIYRENRRQKIFGVIPNYKLM